MKRVIIFGAGQGGKMAKDLMPSGYQIIAFADRDKSKWGSKIGNIPVVSHAKALELNPDCILIAIINQEACAQVRDQLLRSGFQGEVTTIKPLRDHHDIRLAELRLLAEEINLRNVSGMVAELGVFRGEFAAHINYLFPDKTLHLFDTFEGFMKEDIAIEMRYGIQNFKYGDFSMASPEQVLDILPYPEKAIIHKGFFPDTIPEDELTFAFVSLDADLFAPTYSGLCYFYPRLSRGGVILIHDYNSTQYPGAGKAVRKYCRENDLFPLPICDLHGSAVLLKN